MFLDKSISKIDLRQLDEVTQQEINRLINVHHKIYNDVKSKLRSYDSLEEQKQFFQKELESIEQKIHYAQIAGVYDTELQKEKLIIEQVKKEWIG